MRPTFDFDLFSTLRGLDSPTVSHDVEYSKDAVTVTLDVPGVAKEGLLITSSGSQLTIKGERKGPKARTFEKILSVDRRYDMDAIEADLRDGVLTVKIPLRVDVKPRRIELRSV